MEPSNPGPVWRRSTSLNCSMEVTSSCSTR
ncbi:hypothetical protein WP1_202 [Pseudomonas phage WP1]